MTTEIREMFRTVCVVMDKKNTPNVLLQVDSQNPYSGKWHLPCSSSAEEESPQSRAHRTLLKTTRMNLKDSYMVGEYEKNTEAYLFIRYKKLYNDVMESNWFPYNKLPKIPQEHVIILNDALKVYAKEFNKKLELLSIDNTVIESYSDYVSKTEDKKPSKVGKHTPTKKGVTKNARYLASKDIQAFIKILMDVFPDACIGDPTNWMWDKINTKEENRARIIYEMQVMKTSDPSLFVKWKLYGNVMGIKMQVKLANLITSLRRSVLRKESFRGDIKL